MNLNMNKVEYLVLHHTAANNTFAGLLDLAQRRYRGRFRLDYHWFIDLNAEAHQGQPETLVAPHAGVDINDEGRGPVHNWNSLGIAVAGNYENDTMKPDVFTTLVNVLKVLVAKYKIPRANILRHKDVVRTLCPGKNFPYQQVLDFVYKKEDELKPKLYPDVDPNRWSYEAIAYLKKTNIMSGDEKGFRPTDYCTREEVAQVIYNLIKGGR